VSKRTESSWIRIYGSEIANNPERESGISACRDRSPYQSRRATTTATTTARGRTVITQRDRHEFVEIVVERHEFEVRRHVPDVVLDPAVFVVVEKGSNAKESRVLVPGNHR